MDQRKLQRSFGPHCFQFRFFCERVCSSTTCCSPISASAIPLLLLLTLLLFPYCETRQTAKKERLLTTFFCIFSELVDKPFLNLHWWDLKDWIGVKDQLFTHTYPLFVWFVVGSWYIVASLLVLFSIGSTSWLAIWSKALEMFLNSPAV